VKPELETLATVPDEPPAAGPDRALDPPLWGSAWLGIADLEDAAVAVVDPVLAVTLTMP
jgi:hypothetical protein